MRHFLIFMALIASAFAEDYNYSVKVDSNGVLRTPAGFIDSNDIARASTTSNSISSKVSTNDPAYLAALTNATASGATIVVSNRTIYLTVTPSTGTAASVEAELNDHKTNMTAHAGLFGDITNQLLVIAGMTDTWNAAISAGDFTSGTNSLYDAMTNWVAGNPFAWITLTEAAGLTNGLADTNYLSEVVSAYTPTNDSRLSDARTPLAHSQPLASITNAGSAAGSSSNDFATAAQGALAASAIQPYSPTNLTLAYAGSYLRLIDLSGPPASPTLQFWQTDSLSQYPGIMGYEPATYPGQNPAQGYFWRSTAVDGTKWKMYDSGNFIAGTHYLTPSNTNGWTVTSHGSLLATNGNGGSLTGITAGQVGAASTNDPRLTLALTNLVFVTLTNEALVVLQSASSGLATQKIEFANGTYTRARGTNDGGYAKIFFDLNNANLSSLAALGNEKIPWYGAAGAVDNIDSGVTAGYVLTAQGSGQKPTFVAHADVRSVVNTDSNAGVASITGNTLYIGTNDNDSAYLTGVAVNGTTGTVSGGVASVNVGGIRTPGNLLPLVASTTCTITRAMVTTNSYWSIIPTGTVYFAAASDLTDTNIAAGFSVDLFYGSNTFGFVSASMTNTATLVSNQFNSVIFYKGSGQTNFIGR